MNYSVYDFSDKFLDKLKLTKNITMRECIYGTEPPVGVEEVEVKRLTRSIKRNITSAHIYNLIAIAQEAQICRDYFDAPVVIHWGGAFRPLEWEISKNRNGRSQHVLGRALDYHLEGVPLEDVYAFVNRTFKLGGRGMSKEGNFIHKDTRPYRAEWSY